MSKIDNNQKYRPKFHFTAEKGWINDPNGLICLNDEYHLFYQLDPDNINSARENKHWGHAISDDLVRWKYLPIALYPDEIGSAWSGSTVIDEKNCSGLQIGQLKPILAFYTSRTATDQTQSIAFSNDDGLTWEKYKGNPILKVDAPINPNFRDPRVFWHEDTNQWIMVVYRCKAGDKRGFSFYSSDNLINWQFDSWIEGFFECPDLFELPVDGDVSNKKWVLADAKNYALGTFNGKNFVRETEIVKMDKGNNFYATQTWDDKVKDRRVQIAWMRDGSYPDMPFNQQLSFPCKLSLQTFKNQIILCRYPVAEIENYYTDEYFFERSKTDIVNRALKNLKNECFDINVEFNILNNNDFGLIVCGEKILYKPTSNVISFLGCEAVLEPEENTIKLRLLVDKTSIELFSNNGKLSMSSCFLSDKTNMGISVIDNNDKDKPLIKKIEIFKLSFN